MSVTLSPGLPLLPEHAAHTLAIAPSAAAELLSQSLREWLLAALAQARQLPAPATPMLPPAAMPATAPAAPSATSALLSSRECEVLQRIAAGQSNKLIARQLALSPHTVKRHVANILSKLQLDSRVQAAAWWVAQQRPVLPH